MMNKTVFLLSVELKAKWTKQTPKSLMCLQPKTPPCNITLILHLHKQHGSNNTDQEVWSQIQLGKTVLLSINTLTSTTVMRSHQRTHEITAFSALCEIRTLKKACSLSLPDISHHMWNFKILF